MRTSIAHCSCILVVSLVMPSAAASAGDDPSGVRAPPLPVPQTRYGLTAGPREPTAAGVAKSNVFFLNYDGVSIQFTGQEDNSAQNVSQFQEFQGNYAAYGNGSKRAASLQAVISDWSKYDVVITDQRPGQGNYTMCVNSPTNPFGGGVLGIAPLDCNDEQARNIVFAYHSDSDQFTAATQATTMSQEIAHAYGLEHVQQPNDIMNPYNAGGDPSFLDQCLTLDGGGMGILCNAQHNQFCQGAQNSHQELIWLFGSKAPDTTPPSVSITSPANGSMFDAGAGFTITASASDNVAVETVELFNNGSFLQEDNTDPYSWDVQSIPAGNYCFKAVAHDLAGNVAESAENCITVVDPANPDPSTTNATTDEPPPDPTSDTLPDTDSDSMGMSGGSDEGGDVSGDVPTTDGVDPSGNPVGTLPGLPPGYGENDENGCRVAPPPPSAGLLLVGLLALARRRRRES
jgi:MYXO-CTERM domain-containing protein